jgi:hypothetical protein
MHGTAKQEALKHPDGIDKDRDDEKTEYQGAGCRRLSGRDIPWAGIRVFIHGITLLYRTGVSSSDV